MTSAGSQPYHHARDSSAAPISGSIRSFAISGHRRFILNLVAQAGNAPASEAYEASVGLLHYRASTFKTLLGFSSPKLAPPVHPWSGAEN